MTTAALVTAALSGCGAAAHPARPALPDTVDVTCSPKGIAVNVSRAVTRPSGVVLHITSSLPRGSYLSYVSTGGGDSGGNPIQPGQQQWTVALAPGTVTLGCDPVGRMGQGATAAIHITDPGANWRGTRDLETHGCRGGGIVDWVTGFVQNSPSARSAAEAVAHAFEAHVGGSAEFTVTPLRVGYAGGPTQTWLLMKAGAPYASILVHRSGDHYDAEPDARCGTH